METAQEAFLGPLNSLLFLMMFDRCRAAAQSGFARLPPNLDLRCGLMASGRHQAAVGISGIPKRAAKANTLGQD
ncbi:hypothetical protein [Ottowia massiliensis]|uniref:hypothetical protein n=1 Tax=Ottowia massiliensis TaxID=2045302 RepID=UPI0018EC54B8|nr:hypothetical protein [Ottowia massiliensis]